jgi:hypothetical protein
MEVHHHPDLHHKKKNFKEYFLEFLMIFLAVTMGFFAESFREHLVNSEKEHHYAESLYDDLKKDTVSLTTTISQQEMLMQKIQNAVNINMSILKDTVYQHLFYRNFIYAYEWVPIFIRNDATITQLKSAGGFNAISNHSLADSISRLDNYFDRIKYNTEWYIKSCDELLRTSNEFIMIQKITLDSTALGLPPDAKIFSNYDERLLVPVYNNLKIQQSMLGLLVEQEISYKKKSVAILNLLKEEYDLKSE